MEGRQYTIRGIPDNLDAVLREEAATYGKSLNSLLIEKLSQSCKITDKKTTNGLEEFIGSWVEDPAFDEAMKDLDYIDPEDWK